jgi:uncharacterized protein YecT (DUF1311 family)
MPRTPGVCCLIAALMTASVASAFEYKKIDDFKTLETFKSVDEFESSYEEYVHHCLDNTFGGTGGIPCLIGYQMWDRELNIYYKRLMNMLGEKEKALLVESQVAWIKERDKSIAFNSRLLDRQYEKEDGTMYVLMRACDADDLMTPVVKQRALLLKKWFELMNDSAAKSGVSQ